MPGLGAEPTDGKDQMALGLEGWKPGVPALGAMTLPPSPPQQVRHMEAGPESQ